MKSFDYYQPTELRFGRSRVTEAGEVVRQLGSRCLFVTVPETPELASHFARVKESVEGAGVSLSHFDGVIPNPTTDVVTAGAKMGKEFGADVVLGVGGGSSMDTAKAIAVEATHPGSAWDYLYFRESQPTEKTLPVVAITTTSGTGSHVTQVAVITNPQEKNKSALFHPRLYPKVSIVDPELMMTVPPHVTATTGFDVFAHAFESFINPKGSLYTDMMALEAIRLVSRNLPAAVENGQDLEKRTLMAWADTLAGLCIANAGVTLPHGIGMAMGGLFPHVAHGEALACVYPAVMRYTFRHAVERFAAVARILDPSLERVDDETAAEKSCEAVDRFLKAIGLWISLEHLQIPEEELQALAEASLVLPDYKSHPKVANAEDVLDLLLKSFSR
ncbi:MAG: iron-containing alcohol dehydrogenase [Candidatus Aminicenantales bacterium]